MKNPFKKEYKNINNKEEKREIVRSFQKFNYGLVISDTDTGELLHYVGYERIPTHHEMMFLLSELQLDKDSWPDIKGRRFHITFATMEMVNCIKNGDFDDLNKIKVFYTPDEGNHLHIHADRKEDKNEKEN